MKNLYRFSLSFGAIALAAAVHAQVPSTNGTSDTQGNTGIGSSSLGGTGSTTAATIAGYYNTAAGFRALYSNTNGVSNIAVGYDALYANSTGDNNTAVGNEALLFNSGGGNNTALGAGALADNENSSNNTAIGVAALATNKQGDYNIASGVEALFDNTTGSYNTASGYQALYRNTTGDKNVAAGYSALYSNTTGGTNSAYGIGALYANTTGSYNTALGWHAGYDLTTGSNNIDIGNQGVARENGIIRIGTSPTQTATYIAGIYGTSVSGNAVYVSSTGQLGVVVSSERFKTEIAPMGAYTEKLQQLRPVTFHLKTDPKGARQAGLIAEEVAKVYPDLVIRDEKGRIDGVRYDELAPMLLNEMQQQQHEVQRQRQTIAAQAAQIRELKQRQQQFATKADLKKFTEELQTALATGHSTDQLVARR